MRCEAIKDAEIDSLNPYCIGSSNHAEIEILIEIGMNCLNPYCIGSSNHAGSNLCNTECKLVLILIVLDHLIMPNQFTL